MIEKDGMDVVNDHCAGLNVHKKKVVACCLTSQIKKTPTFETKTNGCLRWAIGEPDIKKGPIAEMIINCAETNQRDLKGISSKFGSGVSLWVLRSVTEKVPILGINQSR